jgi:hypothetical protein
MDFEHYAFWESYQQSAGGGGNPFATPNEIKTNIQNGLGVWGGYGVSYFDFVVTLPDTTVNRKFTAGFNPRMINQNSIIN